MTSLPPAQCCIAGHLHSGTPKGEETDIDGILTYVSYPADKSTHNAILFLSDIFGPKLVNSRLIADQFADNGYLVVMPDLFNDDPVPVDHGKEFDIMKWLQKHLPPVTDPIVDRTIDHMRNKLGCKRIGAVGYCYGGKYVVRYLKPGLVDVGFMAHPVDVQADELKGIQGPLSIAAAVSDFLFPTEKRRESEDILAEVGQPYQLSLYSHVEHGYAVRCNLEVKQQRVAKEHSFAQAVSWFHQYLKE
ncbi:dienelactone hydrolase family protein [Aspergillus ibericus CBS 121593]|uniref:Alpha/beta-hydrolase n=1 Tax=Aspergillus ibericus CBS 121593 TaxID=1448316 RepID=A0A395GIP6_9EURO|nr:alpha/beta-hydrolase [Aspergillus ibericus CBS 121593]RAK95325.1 alpha/beta-hydrolase [Aspergillus ibericus CBS 121593]